MLIYFSKFIWEKYLPDNFQILLISEIIFNIVMIILCAIVFLNQIKDNFKSFKENINAYIRFIMPRLAISYLFLFIFSIISMLITKNAVSVNQQSVEALPKYYILPAAIIYAPIVEEILFRGVIRRFIKNNIIFIIVSALVFGLLHTINEATVLSKLVMSLPYASIGAYLAYIYVKTNNIFSNIFSHMFINTVAVVFTILI